jgi:exopolysaccharide biosynthesis polyprenyl glycosylphosphotransferase
MLRELRKPLSIFFWSLNFGAIVASYYAVCYITFGEIRTSLFLSPEHYPLSFWIDVISWIYFSQYFQLYTVKRLAMFSDELLDVLKALGISVALALIPPIFTQSFWDVGSFFARLYVTQVLSLLSLRFVVRTVLKYVRSRGHNHRHVLIVGRNDRAVRLVQRIEQFPEMGLRILGFIDAPNDELHHSCNYPFKVLGTLDDCERIVRENIVDEIFITLPIKSFYSEIEQLIGICETVGIEAKIPTDIFRLRSSKTTISSYLDLAVIDLYTSPRMDFQLISKRIIDVIVSLALTVIMVPLFIIVAILIKSTSRGPILFKQQRVGYNGRLFTLYKFRTMVENAEKLKNVLMGLNEMDGPVFKIKNDPRVTKVGRFLRKTSMDELPQLINVLKGDMSLVGPRPPVPPEVAQYALPDRRRLSMKPGMTGIWQVSGRNNISFDKWMEMDRQYIDHWSLLLDLKILFRTVPVVFRREGAA